ncbi:MAG: undecaprenyl-diphosphate phosphatase [Candidatus Pacebacteria bacterium]|nr:undecaprenyl-diphosphate phosphatase [Candidatus Paceibacterota bacterium]
MSLLHAVLLGIIEGLTEFFPISSTGHLIVAERMMGIREPSVIFNTVIQLGAILAVVVFYRKIIWEMLHNLFSKEKKRLLFYYGVATIPTLLFGFFVRSYIAQLHSNVFVVALTTIVVALFMLYVQRTYAKTLSIGKGEKNWTWEDFFIIGLFQMISIVPGVSRSGITILGGVVRNISFKDAMQISFLLGIPAMSAASGYELFKAFKEPTGIHSNLVLTTSVGFFVSFLVALSTIYFTLPLFKKYGFTPFILYRIVMGVILLLFFAR